MTCPFCRRSTKFEDHGPFRDARSLREFEISGMCQRCQDDFFCDAERGLPCSKPCCVDEPPDEPETSGPTDR